VWPVIIFAVIRLAFSYIMLGYYQAQKSAAPDNMHYVIRGKAHASEKPATVFILTMRLLGQSHTSKVGALL